MFPFITKWDIFPLLETLMLQNIGVSNVNVPLRFFLCSPSNIPNDSFDFTEKPSLRATGRINKLAQYVPKCASENFQMCFNKNKHTLQESPKAHVSKTFL